MKLKIEIDLDLSDLTSRSFLAQLDNGYALDLLDRKITVKSIDILNEQKQLVGKAEIVEENE